MVENRSLFVKNFNWKKNGLSTSILFNLCFCCLNVTYCLSQRIFVIETLFKLMLILHLRQFNIIHGPINSMSLRYMTNVNESFLQKNNNRERYSYRIVVVVSWKSSYGTKVQQSQVENVSSTIFYADIKRWIPLVAFCFTKAGSK